MDQYDSHYPLNGPHPVSPCIVPSTPTPPGISPQAELHQDKQTIEQQAMEMEELRETADRLTQANNSIRVVYYYSVDV